MQVLNSNWKLTNVWTQKTNKIFSQKIFLFMFFLSNFAISSISHFMFSFGFIGFVRFIYFHYKKFLKGFIFAT